MNPSPVGTPYFDSLLIVADRIHDSGYKEKALALVNKAGKNATNPLDKINYFIYTSDIYRKDYHNYDYIISSADSMLRIIEEDRLEKKLAYKYAQAFNMKADALFAKGLFNESFDCYFNAKKIASDNADSCSLSQYSYSLGMALFKQQKFGESARYFQESYTEAGPCRDNFLYFYRKQELLDNIGLCYNRVRQYDSAMYFYQKAIAYINSNYMRFDKTEESYISAKAVVYGNMADIYLARKMFDSAEALLKKSININLQKGYTNSDALIDQVKLANLYLITGKPVDMRETLEKIEAEKDTIPDKQVECSWNKLMWQYYTRERDSVKAFRYILAYERLTDSFTALNKSLMTTDVDDRIRSVEKQYEIRLLNKNNEQQKIYIVVATIFAVMALIIVLLVMRNAGKTRKNIEILTGLNNQVNEQKEKLELAIAELELKDKDKSRILRSVAHDVMNPIAAILSLTDILDNESPNFSSEQKEILLLIKEACTNSLNLSKDILETARSIEKSKATFTREWLDINKLVANCVELLSFTASAKKQRLITEFAQTEIHANVNKEKIWRILNNLISNAIKFSYKNSDIFVSVKTDSYSVHISVKDNGMGIPEKHKSRIFETFTEARHAGTSGELPHGLGLSISLQLARAHNGNLWFESEEGKGTTFHLEFPVNAETNV